jgi:hypothetical protein
MHDIRTYQIAIAGALVEDAFNATSPLQVRVVRSAATAQLAATAQSAAATQPEATATQMRVAADQAGLIGLLRHLHHQGFLLLSVSIPQERLKGGQ